MKTIFKILVKLYTFGAFIWTPFAMMYKWQEMSISDIDDNYEVRKVVYTEKAKLSQSLKYAISNALKWPYHVISNFKDLKGSLSWIRHYLNSTEYKKEAKKLSEDTRLHYLYWENEKVKSELDH